MNAHASADFFNFSATQVVELYIQHGTEGRLDLFTLWSLIVEKIYCIGKSHVLSTFASMFFFSLVFFQFSYVAISNHPNQDLALIRYSFFYKYVKIVEKWPKTCPPNTKKLCSNAVKLATS